MLEFTSNDRLDFLGRVLATQLLEGPALNLRALAGPAPDIESHAGRIGCLDRHLAALDEELRRLFTAGLEKIRINRVYGLLSAFRKSAQERKERMAAAESSSRPPHPVHDEATATHSPSGVLEWFIGGQNLMEFLPDEPGLAELLFGPRSWVRRFSPPQRAELQALLAPFDTSEWRIPFIPPARGPEFYVPGKEPEHEIDEEYKNAISFVHPTMDKFGLVMIEAFKDKPLRWLESIFAGRNLDSPLEVKLAGLDEGFQRMLLFKATRDGETDIHTFLNILEWHHVCIEDDDGVDEEGCPLYTLSIRADGQDVVPLGDEMDGLHYLIFGPTGWVARYSEYPDSEDVALEYANSL